MNQKTFTVLLLHQQKRILYENVEVFYEEVCPSTKRNYRQKPS